MCYFISQGDHNSGELSKGRILPHQHSIDAFLPFAIEVFGCLHQQMNKFFHQRVNMAWSTKGTNGPPLTILHVLYMQRVLVALQRAQAASILRCIIIASENSFRIITLSSFSSLSFLICLLQLVGGLKHDLFLYPLMTHFWFCFFDSHLGPPLVVPFFLCLLLGVLFNEVCTSFIIIIFPNS